MKIFEEKNKKKRGSYLPTPPFANLMAKIKNILKSPVGATSARGWQPQPGKPPSLNFGKGFEEWSQ
jgi:hypothetical protein